MELNFKNFHVTACVHALIKHCARRAHSIHVRALVVILKFVCDAKKLFFPFLMKSKIYIEIFFQKAWPTMARKEDDFYTDIGLEVAF